MNHIRPASDLKTPAVIDLFHKEIRTIAAFVVTNEKRKPEAKYLEIGVWAGSTIRFLKNVTKTTHFYGVDLFEDFVSANDNTHCSGTFQVNDVLDHIGRDRVSLIKGESSNTIPTLNEKFDFIFIDGNHSYKATWEDFKLASSLLAPNGQIGFHNCAAALDPDFEYICNDGGPWLVTQEIIASKQWNLVAQEERLRVFTKVD
jgi:predicted O-methyltransferase YrrM